MAKPTWSMASRKKSHLRKVVFIVVVLVVLVAAVSYGLVKFFGGREVIKAPRVNLAAKTQPKATTARSRVLFMGTTYWGRYTNRAAERSGNKLQFPFEGLKTLQRENYDAWVANLECPLSAKVHLTPEVEDDTLSFNCSPEYLGEAKKWFDVFGSANNHSDNQGEEAFAETRKALEEHKIQYFGHYDPEKLDEVCEIVGIPFEVSFDKGETKNVDLPMALCGFHGVFKMPTDEALAVMEDYSKYMPVIAYPHSGAEYKAEPDQIKTDLYRSMIDHGADLVIGDHPHWVQTTEVYKGKPIIYSMGNFMFDQQYNQEVVRSAAIDIIFEVEDKNLDNWLKLDSCRAFQDDCLKRAEELKLKKLDFKYKLGALATENRGYQTKKATLSDENAVMQRLGWQDFINQLQPPYFRQ